MEEKIGIRMQNNEIQLSNGTNYKNFVYIWFPEFLAFLHSNWLQHVIIFAQEFLSIGKITHENEILY